MAYEPKGRYWGDFKVGETFENEEFAKTSLALLGIDRIRCTGPVRLGDTVHTAMAIKETRPSSKPDRGVVTYEVAVKTRRAGRSCAVSNRCS